MLTTAELKALLKTQHVRLAKRLGQHHLIDARIVRQLVGRCDLSSRDTVIEIGPGLGALTEPLAASAGRVIAVDIDRAVCSLLAQRLAPLVKAGRLTIRCQDILKFSWDGLSQVTVVGAIPYHVTSPILISLCQARAHIRKAILILQAEVAARLLAAPGTKAYGRLSVLIRSCWEVSPLMDISRRAFFPQPTVDSCCVQLTRQDHPPVTVADEPLFFDVVKAAFSHRRKTLVNCLTAEPKVRMERRHVEQLLHELDLPVTVRGETLSLDQFAALANALSRERRLLST